LDWFSRYANVRSIPISASLNVAEAGIGSATKQHSAKHQFDMRQLDCLVNRSHFSLTSNYSHPNESCSGHR
jgi:hypothetical protein